MTPYFITGLPRSRMAWLSNAMTYGDSTCLFEPMSKCKDFPETATLKEMLASTGTSIAGSSDCTYAVFTDQIIKNFPGAKCVVVVRDVRDSIAGMNKLGFLADTRFYDAALGGICAMLRWPQTLRVEYNGLSDPSIGEAIWNHCVPGIPFNRNRWAQLSELNVQVQPAIEQAKVAKLSAQARRFFGDLRCGNHYVN